LASQEAIPRDNSRFKFSPDDTAMSLKGKQSNDIFEEVVAPKITTIMNQLQ
jgi:hypothetical protein